MTVGGRREGVDARSHVSSLGRPKPSLDQASVPQPGARRRGGAWAVRPGAGTRRTPRLAGARAARHPAQPAQGPGEAAGGHQR